MRLAAGRACRPAEQRIVDHRAAASAIGDPCGAPSARRPDARLTEAEEPAKSRYTDPSASIRRAVMLGRYRYSPPRMVTKRGCGFKK